ncbi:restriction endonuclease subunit S [Helicobacter pylori]|uniref:restriction endonuclease subunit S n=1 Tax=Helicobacter pylori TaxID=210 RepID=UPI001922A694|nr:restriction endonuclease subunit S [Helicobacter pylori]QQW91355.1 restriction endonuclease subunit S [Helicobacter pylori]
MLPLMLPLNWQRVRLGDIAEIIGGGTPSTQITSFWNGSINWFTPTEIGITKYVYKSQRTITPLGLKNSSAKLLPIGTILLTSRASIGDCAILKVVATTNQGFQSLIPLEKINNEFLYYLILTLKNKLLKLASGSTFLEVSPNKIKNLLIPLPPLNEQIAIANILSDLDRYLYALDALILKKEGVKKALRIKMLNQILASNGVEFKKIGEICLIKRGRVIAKKILQENGKYPVYSSQTLNNGILGFIDTYDFDGEFLTWTTDGAYAGSVFYRNGRFSITNVCGLLQVIQDNILHKYLYYILQITAPLHVNPGMGNPKLMSVAMQQITIPLPPLNEQSAIANILSALDNEIASLKNKKRQFENIKKALNHDLMSAKIRVLKK